MAYLLATLYVAVVSGSVSETFETLEKVLREPPQALEQVKEAVPTVAVYFITFVLARTGITIPILLFYPGLFPASGCYFATEASDAALILVLGLTYSAIAPLILPACAAYFAVTSVVYRSFPESVEMEDHFHGNRRRTSPVSIECRFLFFTVSTMCSDPEESRT
eukprot:g16271.t1